MGLHPILFPFDTGILLLEKCIQLQDNTTCNQKCHKRIAGNFSYVSVWRPNITRNAINHGVIVVNGVDGGFYGLPCYFLSRVYQGLIN